MKQTDNEIDALFEPVPSAPAENKGGCGNKA